MAETIIDLDRWDRAEHYRFFRGFDRPHYATTVRLDTTHLMEVLKPAGRSVYRTCLFAIATGLHAEPNLRTRFRGDTVVRHDRISLSMTVPKASGSYTYAYVPFDPEPESFDALAARSIAEAAEKDSLDANFGDDAVAYGSCMPWIDFSAFTNPMPGPDDCIPRIGWGRIVADRGRWSMAMTLEVHHALVDGVHVGAFFTAVQRALDTLDPVPQPDS